MKNRKIERKLFMEFKNETPNVLDDVLKNCKAKQKIIKPEKKNFRFYLALATSFVFIFIIGLFSFNQFNSLNKINTIIELDVNPSVELKLNKQKKILEATPLNNDGKKILKDMDLSGSSLNVAMNAIIGSMYKNGYINELKNSILVSVKNDDPKVQDKLQTELTNEINSILDNYQVSPSILTQEYSEIDNILAKENGISNGKAEFIQKIIDSKLTNKNGKLYTFEELVNLNINELNAILNSKNKTINNVTTTGTASTKKYIGTEKARSIALSDAKVLDKDIYDFEIELDYEYGLIIYEVSFDTNGKEYEYTIDATSGKILHKTNEIDDDYNQINPTSNETTTQSNYISRTKAKDIAFKDAGINSSAATDLSIELDKEYGKTFYEISFDANGKEYEYDIDATNGKILNKKVEIDDDYIKPTTSTSNNQKKKNATSYIGTSKAKSIALNNAGVSSNSVRDLEVELDYEYGKTIYEVSFDANGKEYSYDIDALNGSIINKNIEIDD